MNTRALGWIGYDWFKLVVTIILILLLLWFALMGRAPAATTPAEAPAAAVATAGANTLPTAGAGAAGSGAATPASAATSARAPSLELPSGAALLPGPVSLHGTAAPNSRVQVVVDGKPAGTTIADSSGAWALDATIDQPGDHSVVAQALEADGKLGAASSPATLKLGAGAPSLAAPTINLPAAAQSDAPTAIAGTGTPGSTVELVVDGQTAGKAIIGADGSWSIPITLTAGAHEIAARALDAGGAVAATSSPATLNVGAGAASAATAAPTTGAAATAPTVVPAPGASAPAIGFPTDNATLSPGAFTMTGTGTPGSTVEILDSDKVIGTATVGADGSWSFPATPSGGTAAYSARAAGTTDVTAKPIRVTFGAGQAADCSALAPNCDAWVTRKGGLSLRLRAGAGTSQPIVTRLPVGTQLKLLDGPQPDGGLSWWHVRTLGGRDGWVAGEELVLQPD